MPERDYSHRDVVDKLGVKIGHAVAFDTDAVTMEDMLCQRILDRAGRAPASADEQADLALVSVTQGDNFAAVLRRWKVRVKSNGGIWLLTTKRSQPGYVDQRELIAAGAVAGLVDNKVCSVSDTVSAMRFVSRRSERPAWTDAMILGD